MLRVFVAVGVVFFALNCGTSGAGDLGEGDKRYAFEKAEMGVPFRVTLYAPNADTARAGAEAAFERIAALNAILSDYDSDSELSRLSASSGTAAWVPVGEDLWRVLKSAQHFAERSGGAFDLSVGPLVNVWRGARRKNQLPAGERIQEALGRVGYRSVWLDARSRAARLELPRMRLDAGGIAKGYAAQQAVLTLKARGLDRCMVEGGGDIALGAPPPGRLGWRIEVAVFDHPAAPPAQNLEVAHCSVATSGDRYQRVVVDGVRYSHIVNPWTGVGLTDHSLVTVVAPSGMDADALAKVVAVLGPERGLPVVGEIQGAQVRVLRAPGEGVEVRESAGWGALLASP